MSDDPTSSEPRRPLSRREARELAQAQAQARADAEARRAAEAADAADRPRPGGPLPESDAAGDDVTGVPAPDASETGDAETGDSVTNEAETDDAGQEEPGQEDAGPGTRRARSEAVAAEQAPTMPEGSSLEALLHRDEQPASKKRRRGRGCLIAVIVAVVILGGAAAAGFWAWNAYGERIQEALGLDGPHDYEAGEATGEAFITVEEGDTGEALSPKLFEAGVTLESDSFTRYVRENSPDLALFPGVYKLQQKMTSSAVVSALEDPSTRQENSVQLPEGLTVDATIARIAESIDVPEDDLEKAASNPGLYGVDEDSLEGWLFPATYTFDPDASAQDVVSRMVERTRESLKSAGVPDDEVHDVLTIASIIQREARFDDDFYKVSRVIHNRLDPDTWGDTAGRLQMDSTAQYGYGEHHAGKASSSAKALSDDNPWNTYKITGLPAGPIANPGDLAIDAAMNPAKGPWLYFVTVNLNTGETKFSTTYGEHEENVAQWRKWCSANPDAGC